MVVTTTFDFQKHAFSRGQFPEGPRYAFPQQSLLAFAYFKPSSACYAAY